MDASIGTFELIHCEVSHAVIPLLHVLPVRVHILPHPKVTMKYNSIIIIYK